MQKLILATQRKLGILGLVMLIAFNPLTPFALAADKDDAKEYLKQKIDSVVDVLKKENLKETEKKEEIEKIVSSLFDFPLMAKLTLGKDYWPGLSTNEREKFTALFVERLKTSYLDKMLQYTGEAIQFSPAVERGRRKVDIPTYLVTDDQKIMMIYKLYKSRQDWKLYDMEIKGISLIISYSSQFRSILENGTTQDLLNTMENHN